MATIRSSSLIKTILHKSLAEGVYRDVVSRSSNYYYFLGKTIQWETESEPPYPTDSLAYERLVRSDIITMKQINPNDVSFVVSRIDWTPGTVYDMFDDEYSNEIIGLDIISGGVGYTSNPTVTVTGGGGSGARFNTIIDQGQVVGIEVVSRGTGYTSEPTVTVTGGGGNSAQLRAVLNLAYSGANKLEESNFYVMTDSFNVYKCLDNNNNAESTVKPLGSSVEPIVTSDGYVWKFMYNIPINLRNKFLNSSQIPVISALTNQFYSNGTLDSVIVTNKGENYTTASISVSGDGFRESDPLFLSSVSIFNGGQNYVNPSLTIDNPVSDATVFISQATVFLGQVIFTDNLDFYEVVTPGTLSSIAPSHKTGIVQNGSAALKYRGTTAKGNLVVESGVITEVNLIGAVREVTIINGGSGYTSAPTVSFSGGSGSGASAICKINTFDGSVLTVSVINPGDNYTSTPTVIFGQQFPTNTAVLIGQQYFSGNNLYTITSAGTTGNTLPTHSSGSVVSGTATVEYSGQRATGEVVRRFGSGYSRRPNIQVVGGSGTGAELVFLTSKSEAKLVPIIENGQINGISVEDPGIGYTTAQITVNGDGDGATLAADLNIGNISSLQANNEILAVPGSIDAIKIVSGGYGYGVANIEIQGDGVGATATATIDTALGRIVKINIVNPGSGYTFANVVITGNGKGASARVIISPYGGHGNNAPDELFARSLMFYSNVSNDLNQGVLVNNDYRQIGIIKNPRGYLQNTRFVGSIGSACFIIQASVNTSAFPRDTDIFVNRIIGGETFQRRYRVVTSSASSVLVQSLDNDQPLINDIFTNLTGQTFTASSVGNPTVDKYSGQMMFIDNKAGFTPSSDETVTLLTVIQF